MRLSDLVDPQPAPAPRSGAPSMHDVAARLHELRRDHGLSVYGALLQAGNGRNAVVDELQEQLDALVYRVQSVLEQAARAEALAVFRERLVKDLVRGPATQLVLETFDAMMDPAALAARADELAAEILRSEPTRERVAAVDRERVGSVAPRVSLLDTALAAGDLSDADRELFAVADTAFVQLAETLRFVGEPSLLAIVGAVRQVDAENREAGKALAYIQDCLGEENRSPVVSPMVLAERVEKDLMDAERRIGALEQEARARATQVQLWRKSVDEHEYCRRRELPILMAWSRLLGAGVQNPDLFAGVADAGDPAALMDEVLARLLTTVSEKSDRSEGR